MSAVISKDEQHTLYVWDCDDEPNGFEFRVLRALDGDFHLSIVPKKSHEMREHFMACFSASLRIRMPMIGGGRHEHLWDGLAKITKKEYEQQNKRKPKGKS